MILNPTFYHCQSKGRSGPQTPTPYQRELLAQFHAEGRPRCTHIWVGMKTRRVLTTHHPRLWDCALLSVELAAVKCANVWLDNEALTCDAELTSLATLPCTCVADTYPFIVTDPAGRLASAETLTPGYQHTLYIAPEAEELTAWILEATELAIGVECVRVEVSIGAAADAAMLFVVSVGRARWLSCSCDSRGRWPLGFSTST